MSDDETVYSNGSGCHIEGCASVTLSHDKAPYRDEPGCHLNYAEKETFVRFHKEDPKSNVNTSDTAR